MKLDTLEIGKDAVVASVTSDDQALRQHILDMGLTPGTEVTMMKYAPMGDPLEIRLRGYELTLRKDDAARIELVGIHDTDTGPRVNAAIGTTEHPALGEGTYSPRAAKTAVPEGAPLHFALAGNQNCGKTTLFNQLCAYARRFWLHCAGYYVDPHAAVRARPQDDRYAHAVYELLCQAAGLRPAVRGVLSAGDGSRHGLALSDRHHGRLHRGSGAQPHGI